MSGFLLLDSHPLVVIPEVATALGLNEAIIIQQIHYWSVINTQANRNVKDGYVWVYNTYAQWQKQFPWWSERTIKRIISKLENQGILVSENYNRLKVDRTKWYRINYEVLQPLLSSCQIVTLQEDTMARPIPKTTKRTNLHNDIMETMDCSATLTPTLGKNEIPTVRHSNPEISEFIHWYFEQYEEEKGESHPYIKSEQKIRVHDMLDSFCEENGTNVDDLKNMAYAFFDITTSDHNINHFATAGILKQ